MTKKFEKRIERIYLKTKNKTNWPHKFLFETSKNRKILRFNSLFLVELNFSDGFWKKKRHDPGRVFEERFSLAKRDSN